MLTPRPEPGRIPRGARRALGGLLATALALVAAPERVSADSPAPLVLPAPGRAPWKPLTFRSIPKPTEYSTRTGPDGRPVLAAETDCGASGLVLRLDPPIDLRETPRLAWRWRITRPLAGGARAHDERSRDGDDFAARVYVLFPFDSERASLLDRWQRALGERWYGRDLPGATLTYVWPREIARDTTWTSPFRDEVKLVAAEDPTRDGGATAWREATLNVARDARLGLGLAPDVPAVGIGIMTDADETCEVAGAEYGDFRWLGPDERARIDPPLARSRDARPEHELP